LRDRLPALPGHRVRVEPRSRVSALARATARLPGYRCLSRGVRTLHRDEQGAGGLAPGSALVAAPIPTYSLQSTAYGLRGRSIRQHRPTKTVAAIKPFWLRPPGRAVHRWMENGKGKAAGGCSRPPGEATGLATSGGTR